MDRGAGAGNTSDTKHTGIKGFVGRAPRVVIHACRHREEKEGKLQSVKLRDEPVAVMPHHNAIQHTAAGVDKYSRGE